MKRFLFVVLTVFVFGSVVMAQDAPSCDVNQLANDITVQIAEMESDPVTSLLAIMQIAMSGASECGGNSYHFSSETEGQQAVIGPVSFPKGVYIFTLTTGNFGTVTAQQLSECGGFDMMLPIFAIFDTSAANGAKKAIEVEADCEVLLEVGSMMSPTWTMDIEKVS